MSKSRIGVIVDNKTQLSGISSTIASQSGEQFLVRLGRLEGSHEELLGPVKELESYGPSEPEVRRNTMQWIRNWANLALPENSSIKQLLVYRGVSLWWFLDPWWILLGNRYFPYLHESIHFLEQISGLIVKEKPTQIISYTSNPNFNSVLVAACKQFGISVSVPHRRNRQIFKMKGTALLSIARFAARAILYRVQSCVFPEKQDGRGKDRLVVLSGDHWGRLWDPQTGKVVEGES